MGLAKGVVQCPGVTILVQTRQVLLSGITEFLKVLTKLKNIFSLKQDGLLFPRRDDIL